MDIILVVVILLVLMFGLALSRGLTLKLLARRGKEITATIVSTQKYTGSSGVRQSKWRYEYSVGDKAYRGSSFINLPDESTDIRIVYDPSFPFLSAPYALVEEVKKLYQK